MPLKVPAVGGSQWAAAECQRGESLCGNSLRTLLDFCGSPQNDAVERVKGIEPSLSAWEAEVLPLNYTRIAGRPLRQYNISLFRDACHCLCRFM